MPLACHTSAQSWAQAAARPITIFVTFLGQVRCKRAATREGERMAGDFKRMKLTGKDKVWGLVLAAVMLSYFIWGR